MTPKAQVTKEKTDELIIKTKIGGASWWSSGQDFSAFTAVAWVQSRVGELRSRKPCSTAKTPNFKNYFVLQRTPSREWKSIDWEKVFANHRSEMEFASSIYFENFYTDTKDGQRHYKKLQISFVNIDIEILNKIWANQSSILKGLYTMTKWVLFLEFENVSTDKN